MIEVSETEAVKLKWPVEGKIYNTFYGYITNSQSDQLPDGLIAQLLKHCIGIADVMGSNPVQAGFFFGL